MNNSLFNANQQDDIAQIMNNYVDLALAMQQEADEERRELEQILKATEQKINNGDSGVQPDTNQDLKQFAAQATADQTTS